MIILLSIYGLFILYLIIYMLKLWDIRKNYGKPIVKLRERKTLLSFFILALLFWIVMLALNISNYMEFDSHRDLSQILLCTMWILICFAHISRVIKYSEIREKGIYLERGFYSWNKIYSYKWITSNTIEFEAKRFILNDLKEKVEINYDDKEMIDKILKKYILINTRG